MNYKMKKTESKEDRSSHPSKQLFLSEKELKLIDGLITRDPKSVTKFVKEVNDRTIKWPLHFSNGSEIGGDSDHTSFNNKGMPHAFFFSGHHEDVHMPTDDVEKIDFEKMQKISQLVYLLTKELGNKETLSFK